MQKSYKETAVANVPKGNLAYFNKDSLKYTDFLIKQLSSQLAERIMTVLLHEGEIVASLSDLRVEEYMPTNSLEYKRQIEWSPLVRCRDCKYYNNRRNIYDNAICEILYCCDGVHRKVCELDFCSYGERRTDE